MSLCDVGLIVVSLNMAAVTGSLSYTFTHQEFGVDVIPAV